MGMKKIPIPQIKKAAGNDKRPVLRGVATASRRNDFAARHRERPTATDMERRPVLVAVSAVVLQKRRAAGDSERF